MLPSIDLKDVCAKIQGLIKDVCHSVEKPENSEWLGKVGDLYELIEDVPDLQTNDEAHRQTHSINMEKVERWLSESTAECNIDYQHQQRQELARDRFKLLAYKAECAFGKDEQTSAVELVLSAKQLLSQFPKESTYLSMMCYNNGVDCYHKQIYKQAEDWLRLSYDIGQLSPSVSHDQQAKTLRLLANCYLDWDTEHQLQKADNTISLANSEHLHIAGMYLKLRVSLISGDSVDVISVVVSRLLQHSDLTVPMSLTAASLLQQHNRLDTALSFLEESTAKFTNNSDTGHLHLARLHVLIEMNQAEKTTEFIQSIITANNTDSTLDLATKKKLHLVFWEQAANYMEAGDYSSSLEWYNYSASLFGLCDDDQNRAKLHRNRATCYLHLGNIDNAKEAVNEAQAYESDYPYTQYIVYKIAISEGDSSMASEALKKMTVSSRAQPSMENKSDMPSAHDLICLAAQTALDNNNEDVALTALSCLVEGNDDIKQVLVTLRCTIRIQLGRLETQRCDVNSIVENLIIAEKKLDSVCRNIQTDTTENFVQNEAEWFSKIAWNLALQCEEQLEVFKHLFQLSYKFCAMEGCEPNTMSRQKTCLMMAAAAGLQQGRLMTHPNEQVCLREVLEAVNSCRQICDRMHHSILAGENRRRDTTEILLLLYEFEAKSKLGDSSLEAVLEKLLALPYSEAKTFETIAGLSMEAPANHRVIAIRALKAAIRKHLQQPAPDVVKLSKLFHSLVMLALRGASSVGGTNKDEAFAYCHEVVDIIDNKTWNDYPELELVWLMTKIWNCGIHFFSSGLSRDAEKWCALSMTLLKHLEAMRTTYQLQMGTVYGDILAQVGRDGVPAQSGMEE